MPPALHLTPPAALLFDAALGGRWHFDMQQPAPALLDPSNPKWIQICTAGRYTYHGRPAPMTDDVFDQMAANFRTDPAYRPDARSLLGRPFAEVEPLVRAGVYGVVGLNFDHPPMGGPRPACGWLLEVERRPDPAGGPSTFWALAFFGSRAYQGMLEREWSWTSIEFGLAAQDNQGREIGALLTGCALTNNPFVTGMRAIQMSATAAANPAPIVWFGPAADVVTELKCCLGLPETADAGTLLGEIAKLRAWVLGPTPAPLGVDVFALLEKIRGVLNLPRPPDPTIIFAHLDTLLGHLADEHERETPMPNETPAAKPTELSRRIAQRLSTLGPMFFGAQAPAVSAEDEPRLTADLERFFDRATAFKESLDGMMQASGKTDPKEITAMLTQAVTLTSQIKQLEDQLAALLPEVEAAHVAEEQAEGEMASQDVAAVMSRLTSLGWTEKALESQRGVLMLQRLGGDLQYFGRFQRDGQGNTKINPATGKPIVASPAERQAFRRAAAAKFREEHQIQRADQMNTQAQSYSFANLYAGPGAQFTGAEQRQGGTPWMGFSNPQNGQQGVPPPPPPLPPATHSAWTWSRVAGLPPGTGEDTVVNRIVDDINRSEFGGKASKAQESAIFARVPDILSQLGEMPPQFFSTFRRVA